jgi:hypothetical protein
MRDAEKAEFKNLLGALCASFRVEPTTPFFQGYWLGLKSLDLAEFERAVGKALESSRFMPTPVELRELAGEMSSNARATHAWNEVRKAIRGKGAWASVAFDCPAINAAVRNLGGWRRLCSLDSEELDKWTRKEFEKVYGTLLQTGFPDYEGRYLEGVHEADNRQNGYKVDPPQEVRTGLPPLPARLMLGKVEDKSKPRLDPVPPDDDKGQT